MSIFYACDVASEDVNTALLCKVGAHSAARLPIEKRLRRGWPVLVVILPRSNAGRNHCWQEGGARNVIGKSLVHVKMNMLSANDYALMHAYVQVAKHDLSAGWTHNCRMHALS